MRNCRKALIGLVLSFLFFATYALAQQTDPLPSWNDGAAKKAILDFVRVTTDKDSDKFVLPEKRIATFDQDGTLWVEHCGFAKYESMAYGFRHGLRGTIIKASSDRALDTYRLNLSTNRPEVMEAATRVADY